MNKSLHHIFSLFPNPRDAFIFLYLLSLADDNGVVDGNLSQVSKGIGVSKSTLFEFLKTYNGTILERSVERSASRSATRKEVRITICNIEQYACATSFSKSFEKSFTERNTERSLNEQAVPPVPPAPKKRFQKPTIEQVRAYVREQHYSFSPEAFYDFYEANGWVQGKGKPIRSWQAACRTWQRYNTTSTKPMSTALKQQDLNFADDKQNDW